ncbi:MAG: aminopeptidase P family protein [Prolixibacteraceae bacterium]|jgi:Xaa-Pro aminopeptidase|nr:aminopeptidase P family protein [Prolixibacteraceae bacterium]
MIKKGLQAFYIHGSDPHASEYLPGRWQERAFISGFTGSYGWLAITLNEAALWTDSRYFLQAENELQGSGIEMLKARLPETPDVPQWLIPRMPAGAKVGFNAECLPFSLYKNMAVRFSVKGFSMFDTGDLLDEIWDNRPPLPQSPVFEHELKYTGESRVEKINRIRAAMVEKDADQHILTALDDIAWTFNLRGSDIEFNPVFLSYAIIGKQQSILFIDPEKLPCDLKAQLEKEGIYIREYQSIFNFLKEIKISEKIYIDPDKTNCAIISSIPASCKIVEGLSIPCLLKAQKNITEIANIRQAMKKDGIALLEFWHWLEDSVDNEEITEYDLVVKLNQFRQKQTGFRCDSFYPVVGYKAHGAMVHLHVNETNALKVEKDGILLFDSGGHYLDGTTDITRTIALGTPTDQQKSDFTLALKGMIALSEAIFPEHTRGCHLDILARKALWENGLNYGHGTSHGVGFFLNVHEGPVSIRPDLSDQTIKKGMVLSNEPGFYREGEYGIRTENLMVCVEKQNSAFGKFLGFETLTLFPIDTRIIAPELLSTKEIQWVNNYHQQVWEKLSPMVSGELKLFLQEKTKEKRLPFY